MEKLYIITGANGHLGNALTRLLLSKKVSIRGLILPNTERPFKEVQYLEGDITNTDTLLSLFENTGEKEIVFIHTAGIVSIADKLSDKLIDVNVHGTENMIELALKHNVSKFVYVSSVHALPQAPLKVISETDNFSPDLVKGAYAKTKAAATAAVLDSVKLGLNAVVVHPSGILGPFDTNGNHLVQMVVDYIRGKLPAGVKGGFDFVDVRDVAEGIFKAAENGCAGECFILSNRYYEISELLDMIRSVSGGRKLPILPMWLARAALPLMKFIAACRKKRPLYTEYSLFTLSGKDRFSHDKATRLLDFYPRELLETIRDTVEWIKSQQPSKSHPKHKAKKRSPLSNPV